MDIGSPYLGLPIIISAVETIGIEGDRVKP